MGHVTCPASAFSALMIRSVRRPASPTPWSILKLMEVLDHILPGGIVNVVTGQHFVTRSASCRTGSASPDELLTPLSRLCAGQEAEWP